MKRKVVLLAVLLGTTLTFTACTDVNVNVDTNTSSETEASEEDSSEEEEDEAGSDEQETEADAEESETEDAKEEESSSEEEEDSEKIEYPELPLPEYHYYGPEDWADLADAAGHFLIENSFGNSSYDLGTCTPIVFKVDDSDPKDVKLWGEYSINMYQLVKTSLINTAGGSFPGIAHIDNSGQSPVVTKMELVEDGSDFEPSFDRLFVKAGLKDEYQEAMDNINEYVATALSYYINHNGLYITQYQNYGWAPVPIPNAPETRDEDQIVDHVGNFGYTAQYDMREICESELDDADMFSAVDSDERNDFMIEIYSEKGDDVDDAIKKIKDNLFDDDVKLTKEVDVEFNKNEGCTRLSNEPPFKDGDKVYVIYIVPQGSDLLVIEVTSDYSKDEDKQMATDEVIEGFLGSIEIK